MRDSRASQLASALRLSYITIALNGVTGAAALTLAVLSGSLALAGFALSAILDTSASVVLVWRFRREQNDPAAAEHLERRAQAFIAVAMLVVSIYIGFKAVRALTETSHVDEPPVGVALAALALIVLPWLGRRKLEVAAALDSRACGVTPCSRWPLRRSLLSRSLRSSLRPWPDGGGPILSLHL